MLKRNAALLIMLWLGASAPEANAAPAGPETLSGSLSPGWNLVAVPFANAEVPLGWLSADVVVWSLPRPSNPASLLEWTALSSMGDPNERPWLSQGGYWVHAKNPQVFHIRKAIEAPPSGQADNRAQDRARLPTPPASPLDGVFLASHHTQPHFESGPRRVVRWDASTSSYVRVPGADDLKPSEGAFVLSRSSPDPDPFTPSSEDGPLDTPDGNASSLPDTVLAERQSAPWIRAGTFEPPEPLGVSDGPARMARAALSTNSTGMTAHLAYVVQRRATAAGDEIRYQFSDKAGKPGSFSAPRTFSVPESPGSVHALALAARADRVAIAWIVLTNTGDEQDSHESEATGKGAPVQVVTVESRDGGRSFGPKTVVRKNEAWKRGVDVAFDAHLNQHLVWGEANKVYYLMNTEGPPSNVFDNTYRVPVHEEVKYLVQEAPTGGQGCACADCWCEESYVRGGASDASSDGMGSVETESYRVSRYVLDPTLHVSKGAVHVAAQETRLWDPKPVPHPAWTAMLDSPVYEPRAPLSESLVSLPGPSLPTAADHAPLLRRVVGWRSVWKTAYEPGDEALWDTFGFQFQYRYAGTWQEEDHIVLARRPLAPNHHPPQEGSPNAAADARKSEAQQTSVVNTVDAWQVSTLASVGVGGADHPPSYLKLVGAPFGLVLAYEGGGPADPDRIGDPPIRVRWSADEGRSWSDPNTVGRGAKPTAGVSETGDIRVLYRRAHPAAVNATAPQPRASGVFAVVGHRDQHPWSPPIPVDPEDATPRLGSHESPATRGRYTGTSLAVQGDLFFVAWADGEDILTSRASRDENAVQYSVALPNRLTQGKKSPITVTAENRHHMRVNTTETLSVATAFAASQGAAFGSPQSVARNAGLNSLAQSSGDAGGVSGSSGEGTPFSVSLIHGQATFQADPKDLRIFGAAGTVELTSFPLATGAVLIEGASGPPKPQFSASAHGNYEKAKWLRDALWRDGPPTPQGRPTGYQVEYQAVRDDDRTEAHAAKWLADSEGKTEDSSVLAQYERVWAYTQGIALAQYAKRGTQKFDQRAQALARYVCAHAVRDSSDGKQAPVIRGWPFSWNTKNDTWKDARLVTGATAWVVHGLGVFLVSDALQSLPEEEQKVLRGCYQEALWGLRAHQRSIVLEDGRRASLVSAGRTTAGLSHARSPWQLMGRDGKPMALDGEHWDYYDILDAIGYDTFDPDREVRIARVWERPYPIAGDLTVGLSPKVLTESEIGILKQARRAQNIVTEHNLDVLSVLNHALEHAPSLGLGDETAELAAWRDGLRRGIFEGLFDRDDHRWRQDLEGALEQADTNPTKQAEIKQALWRGAWGRVSTGGGLRPASEHAHDFHFVPSRHTAIDNCSWLSLSVDYKTLTDSEPIDALARCLEFTALAFGKDIRFGKNTYYGAHYFFDGFEDPYIQATNRQEQSFHLEATAGLVMGLLAFVEHHPKHHKSDFFEREAHRLWGGVQAFVIDHDFPYSSQRILDLSTLLNSSTALIWFIDAYENLNEVSNRWQQPLQHYASDVDRKDTAKAVEAAHEGLKALVHPETHLLQEQDGEPAFTRIDEQAMALVAAVASADWEHAERLATALLDTRRSAPRPAAEGETRLEFLPLVDTATGEALFPYRSTRTQMTAYLALAQYLRALEDLGPTQNPSVQEAVKRALQEGLFTMVHLYLDESDAGTKGLFVAGDAEVAPGQPSRADTLTNVLAYFVFEESQATEPGTPLFEPWPWFSQLKERVAGLCTDGAASVLRSGEFQPPSTESLANSTALLCTLFLAHSGLSPEAVLDVPRWSPGSAEGLAASEEAPLTEWRTFTRLYRPQEPALWAQLAAAGFKYRAKARLDPRQEALALEAFDRHTRLNDQPNGIAAHHLAVLLSYLPGGVMGTPRTPLFWSPELTYGGVPALEWPNIEWVLLDSIRALLVTPFEPLQFDAMFHRVAFLYFLRTQFIEGNSPENWAQNLGRDRSHWAIQAIVYLEKPCAYGYGVLPNDERDSASFLGFGCEKATRLYHDLQAKRLGGQAEYKLSSLVSGWAPHAFDAFVEALIQRKKAPELWIRETSSDDLKCVTCALAQAPWPDLKNGAVGTQAQIHKTLERTYHEAIAAILRDAPGSVFDFDLDSIDAIDALNPGSPSYYSHGALVFRSVLQIQDRILFDAESPMHAFGRPLSADAVHSLRDLRGRLHEQWDGNLARAAFELGVLPDVLHRAIQLGVLPSDIRDRFHQWEANPAAWSNQSKNGLTVKPFSGLHPEDITRCSQVTAIPPAECIALASLYRATSPEHWAYTWLYNSEPCDWKGVTCFGGRVRALRLKDFGLRGAIPEAFAGSDALSQLEVLDLTSNDLHGPLPASLALLRNLRHFDVFGNEFTGKIPSWIGRLTRLEKLDLSYNPWVGNIPSELGQLVKLVDLDLGLADLSGPIPPSFQNLKNLVSLSLSHNALEGPLPPWLGELPGLRVLSLRDNRFDEGIPEELGQLSALVHLHLDENFLTGSIPPSLGALPALSYLRLNNNQLTGEVPSELWDIDFLGVDLSNNRLRGQATPPMAVFPLDAHQNALRDTRELWFPPEPELGSSEGVVRIENTTNQDFAVEVGHEGGFSELSFRSSRDGVLEERVSPEGSAVSITVPAMGTVDVLVQVHREKADFPSGERVAFGLLTFVHGERRVQWKRDLVVLRSQNTADVGLAQVWLTNAHAAPDPPELQTAPAENLVPSWVRDLASWWADKPLMTLSAGQGPVLIEPIGNVVLGPSLSGSYGSQTFEVTNPSEHAVTVRLLSTLSSVEFLDGVEVDFDAGETRSIEVSVDVDALEQDLEGAGIGELIFETEGAGVESRLVQVLPQSDPEASFFSFGLGQSGHTYMAAFEGQDGGWVDLAEVDAEDMVWPEEQGLVSYLGRFLKPGKPLSVVIKKGTEGLAKSLGDDVAKLGPTSLQVGTAELMATGMAASTLVGFYFGAAETWTTLVQLNQAPNLATEPWEFVGYVQEHEVTTLFGLAFRDEDLIRDHVQITQSHVLGGFSTSTVEFDPDVTYGLVKEVHTPISAFKTLEPGPEDGGILPSHPKAEFWQPHFALPTGEPIAVYRLKTELTPAEVHSAVIENQPAYDFLEVAADAITGGGAQASELLQVVKDYVLEPAWDGKGDFNASVNAIDSAYWAWAQTGWLVLANLQKQDWFLKLSSQQQWGYLQTMLNPEFSPRGEASLPTKVHRGDSLDPLFVGIDLASTREGSLFEGRVNWTLTPPVNFVPWAEYTWLPTENGWAVLSVNSKDKVKLPPSVQSLYWMPGKIKMTLETFLAELGLVPTPDEEGTPPETAVPDESGGTAFGNGIAYYGLPFETYVSAVRNVEGPLHFVSAIDPSLAFSERGLRSYESGDDVLSYLTLENAGAKTAARDEDSFYSDSRPGFLLLNEDPTFSDGQDAIFKAAVKAGKGKAWVYTVHPPHGSMHVGTLLESLGRPVSDDLKGKVVSPAPLSGWMTYSAYQMDKKGRVIPGTRQVNSKFVGPLRVPGGAISETYVDSVPVSDEELEERRQALNQMTKLSLTDPLTLSDYNRGRLTAGTIQVRSSKHQPLGPDGAFEVGTRPGDLQVLYAASFLPTAEFFTGRYSPLKYLYYYENDGRTVALQSVGKASMAGESVSDDYLTAEQIIGAQEYYWDPVQEKVINGKYFANSNHVPRAAGSKVDD